MYTEQKEGKEATTLNLGTTDDDDGDPCTIIVRSCRRTWRRRRKESSSERSCDARVSKTGFCLAGQNILERRSRDDGEELVVVGLHAVCTSFGS